MKAKKIIVLLLSCSMALESVVPVFAEQISGAAPERNQIRKINR